RDYKDEQPLPVLGNGKNQLDLACIYRERLSESCTLSGLVFPQFSPEERVSRLEPVPQGKAMITILPLTMVCFDRTTSKTHFDFVAKLTTKLPAVRLVMGQDRERWHLLI